MLIIYIQILYCHKVNIAISDKAANKNYAKINGRNLLKLLQRSFIFKIVINRQMISHKLYEGAHDKYEVNIMVQIPNLSKMDFI